MIEILLGALMFGITQISKKRKIPSTYLIAGMLVVIGGVYTFIEQNNPDLLVKLTSFVTTAFATSQALWLAYNKLNQNFNIDKAVGINPETAVKPTEPTII